MRVISHLIPLPMKLLCWFKTLPAMRPRLPPQSSGLYVPDRLAKRWNRRAREQPCRNFCQPALSVRASRLMCFPRFQQSRRRSKKTHKTSIQGNVQAELAVTETRVDRVCGRLRRAGANPLRVRSLENFPNVATFRMTLRAHFSGYAWSSPSLSCAST
jgi:hypothetical protein